MAEEPMRYADPEPAEASATTSSHAAPSTDDFGRSGLERLHSEMRQHPSQQDHPLSNPPEHISTEDDGNGPSNRTVRYLKPYLQTLLCSRLNLLKHRRVLWGKHVFVSRIYSSTKEISPLTERQMITFSGVLGVGFYTRSGTILRTAGPLAPFLAFTILTALAGGVMQCITEMFSIWPVPGALFEFVRTFLDDDLAWTVGIAYWYVLHSGLRVLRSWSFSDHAHFPRLSLYRLILSRFAYAITFPAFTTAIAADLTPPKAIDGTILFFLVPIIIIFINSLGVRVCRFEVEGSLTKSGLIVKFSSMASLSWLVAA